MTSCAQCKQRLIAKEARVNCNGCKRYIHERCLARFLDSSKKQECCSRNLSNLGISIARGGPIIPRLSEQTGARTSLFDSARNIDLNNSFMSNSTLNHDLHTSNMQNPNHSVCGGWNNFSMPMQSSMAGHNMSEFQANASSLNRSQNFQPIVPHQMQQSMSSQSGSAQQLPTNWHQMSEVERSGMLFQMLAQNQTTMQSLVHDYRQIRSELTDYSVRLSTLENKNESLSTNSSAEFNQLKDLRRRGASTAELKVGGIPVDNTVAFPDLANKLLEVLKLQNLCSDILEVFEIKAKKKRGIAAAPTDNVDARGENGRNNAAARTDNVDARGENGHNKISFIIKFKSQFISQHVLKIKRQHGIVKFKDLVPDGADNVITIFEMLPPFLNELRILAKDRYVKKK